MQFEVICQVTSLREAINVMLSLYYEKYGYTP